MGTNTTNYNLYKPAVGETGWGEEVNTGFDTIDTTMQANEDAIALNTTHRTSDGTDHSDVVLNNTHRSSDGSDHTYIDQDVTSGSSPTFDGANITGVDAANVDIADAGTIITATDVEGALQENRTAIDLNTTHRSSDGSDHTYIDQDVTSGSSPTFDGANLTGVDAANVDIADAGTIITATDVEGALQENRTAIDLNTTHRGSDGSDHTYIDQDVTSGSSPTFDGANFTGVDAANVDIADAGNIITATDVEGALQENRTAIDLNTTHSSSDGSDHSLVNSSLVSAVNFVIDGGGAAITTGIKGDVEIPFACTINQVTMLADQSGSIVVDIWKDTYANFAPTDADSITAAAVPTISAAIKSQDSTLTGWTTSVSAGDILRFNVDSISTIERVTISLKVTKT